MTSLLASRGRIVASMAGTASGRRGMGGEKWCSRGDDNGGIATGPCAGLDLKNKLNWYSRAFVTGTRWEVSMG